MVWWQVQKQSGQNILALKEVNLHNPAFGKDKKSRDSNVEKIISELTIIKEQALGSIQITSGTVFGQYDYMLEVNVLLIYL